MVLTAVPHDGGRVMRRYVPTLSDAQLQLRPCSPVRPATWPTPCAVTARPTAGYVSVQRQHAESFSKVIAELR